MKPNGIPTKLAEDLERAQRFDEAVPHFKWLAEHTAEGARMWRTVANVAQNAGDRGAAIEALERSLGRKSRVSEDAADDGEGEGGDDEPAAASQTRRPAATPAKRTKDLFEVDIDAE